MSNDINYEERFVLTSEGQIQDLEDPRSPCTKIEFHRSDDKLAIIKWLNGLAFMYRMDIAAIKENPQFRAGIRAAADNVFYQSVNAEDNDVAVMYHNIALRLLFLSPEDKEEWASIDEAYQRGLKEGAKKASEIPEASRENPSWKQELRSLIRDAFPSNGKPANIGTSKYKVRGEE